MNPTNCSDSRQATLPLYLPISYAAAREVGPAAQTLGALYTLADSRSGRTFAGLATIAARAGVSRASVRLHLGKLELAGWIIRIGREGRRTVTWRLAPKAHQLKAPYGRFTAAPGQACVRPTWASRLVLAVLSGRDAAIPEGAAPRPRDVLRAAEVARLTGLSSKSVRGVFSELRENVRLPESIGRLVPRSPAELSPGREGENLSTVPAPLPVCEVGKSSHRRDLKSREDLHLKARAAGEAGEGPPTKAVSRQQAPSARRRWLRGVQREDLADGVRLERLRLRALSEGVLSPDTPPAQVAALAAYALDVARDPPAYFASALAKGRPDAPAEYLQRETRRSAGWSQEVAEAAEWAELNRWQEVRQEQSAQLAALEAGCAAPPHSQPPAGTGPKRLGDLLAEKLARVG